MMILHAKFVPLGLSTEDAETYIGTPDLFAAMREAGWIAPCMPPWRKPVLWSREDLQAACDRYIAGERLEGPKTGGDVVIQVVVKVLPLALNATEAAEYIGAPKVFDDTRDAGWLVPCPGASHRTTLYARRDLDAAFARYYAGEYPEA